jgi:hypothetical protein
VALHLIRNCYSALSSRASRQHVEVAFPGGVPVFVICDRACEAVDGAGVGRGRAYLTRGCPDRCALCGSFALNVGGCLEYNITRPRACCTGHVRFDHAGATAGDSSKRGRRSGVLPMFSNGCDASARSEHPRGSGWDLRTENFCLTLLWSEGSEGRHACFCNELEDYVVLQKGMSDPLAMK